MLRAEDFLLFLSVDVKHNGSLLPDTDLLSRVEESEDGPQFGLRKFSQTGHSPARGETRTGQITRLLSVLSSQYTARQ